MIPLSIFGGLIAIFVIVALLFWFYVRKVTYTTGELHDENHYYEPRGWAIGLTFVIFVLMLGFIK